MKTEKELLELKKKMETILEDKILNELLTITPKQKRTLRIKIGMIESVLNKK